MHRGDICLYKHNFLVYVKSKAGDQICSVDKLCMCGQLCSVCEYMSAGVHTCVNMYM